MQNIKSIWVRFGVSRIQYLLLTGWQKVWDVNVSQITEQSTADTGISQLPDIPNHRKLKLLAHVQMLI